MTNIKDSFISASFNSSALNAKTTELFNNSVELNCSKQTTNLPIIPSKGIASASETAEYFVQKLQIWPEAGS